MQKNGFTLAETLITLVIIGVIAALTVPNMIQQHKRQETSAKLKKFYSTLSQAQIKAKADGNDWDDWANNITLTNQESFQEFSKYLIPYLSYSKVETVNNNYSYIYLNDGSNFMYAKGDCIDFHYDINGKKTPNKEGKDIFRFLYCPKNKTAYIQNKVSPFITKAYYNRSLALSKCSEIPSWCSGLLMLDSWEFKDDYPYRL